MDPIYNHEFSGSSGAGVHLDVAGADITDEVLRLLSRLERGTEVRPSSHQTYRGYIDNHIRPNIGDIPLEKLTSLELQKLYKKLLAKGRVDRLESKGQPQRLSVKTVRNIHQILSPALKLAQRQAAGKWQPSYLVRYRPFRPFPLQFPTWVKIWVMNEWQK